LKIKTSHLVFATKKHKKHKPSSCLLCLFAASRS
jgi:hypothetical protein